MVHSGIILLKYWLEVSQDEQTRRLEDRIDDGRKLWKLSPMDLKSYSRWHDYTRARDDMFAASDTPWAPWYVVSADHKWLTQALVVRILVETIRSLDLQWPEVSESEHKANAEARRQLEAEA